MKPKGPVLEEGDERILRARYLAVLDAGHNRNCALAFARAYLFERALRIEAHCCCGRHQRARRYRRAA